LERSQPSGSKCLKIFLKQTCINCASEHAAFLIMQAGGKADWLQENLFFIRHIFLDTNLKLSDYI